ncbi:DNA polymerase [Poseidonocella pacifica]|uniref:Type-4 uracil-DNA glycosylase n=1 Tax=Poseidonocella pacifica TaxID=871651 RepID=A0A1I0X4R0_9RHOB|nr:UdgX family uracil-DNA binding protein [Poseidonocella pacifica]SFA95911.1 DNA polymerase [Poseidonocella pacifica]
MTYVVNLPRVGFAQAWREAARRCLGAEIPPEEVSFNTSGGLFAARELPAAPASAPALKIPRTAVQTLEQAICHRDPEVFSRAYAVLWALGQGTLRWGDRSVPMMRKLLDQAKAVGRDIHKMHAFVRFREGPARGDRRAFAAWFEPEHNIVEAATPFFARRFGDMDWVIATPKVTATFRSGQLSFQETENPSPPPEDATEALWCTYYASIFNPARLMISAMQSEMPKKAWKNLPETRQIPELIRTAPERARAMQDAAPTMPPAHAAALSRARKETMGPAPSGMKALKHEAATCTRCPIGPCATQVVWGEGPETADLMIVGEQPGDQEDLAGRPFVGPAGTLLDKVMQEAGVQRDEAYLTNAVKHFKFSPRGKRRVHERPNAGEVQACKWWLDQEIARVRPRAAIALGATAALALTGSGERITRRRGTIEAGTGGLPVFLTIHPAFILRIPDKERAAEERRRFVEDLSIVRETLREM